MAEISKLNAIAIADVEKVDSVAAADIAKINGLVFTQPIDDRFIIEIDTSLGDGLAEFHPSIDQIGTITIDWGDGSSNTITSDSDPNLDHTYSSGGVYTVSVERVVGTYRYNNDVRDRAKITDVKNWGNWPGRNMASHTNLSTDTATDSPDFPNFSPANTAEVFFYITSFNGDVSNWDMSTVTTLRRMFRSSQFNGAVNSWDVSSVTNFNEVFRLCPFNQDVSNWDTSSATSMNQTFFQNSSFNQDLGNWNIGLVTSCSLMISTAMSTSNYDSLLIGWAAQAPNIQTGVTLSAGPQYTSAAASARNVLTSTYSWTITDGGQAP